MNYNCNESNPKVETLANWLEKGDCVWVGAAAKGKVVDPAATETNGK